MDFASKFPASTWFWHKVTSRRSKNIVVGLLAVVLLVAVALRIEAAIFAYRAHRVLFELSQLHSGKTTRSQLLQRIPALHPAQPQFGILVRRNADEGLELEIPNSRSSGWITTRLPQIASKLSSRAAQWVGFRVWGFRAWVNIDSGIVSGYGYDLSVWDGSGQYPGRILARGAEVRHFDDWNLIPSEDQSPDYKVTHYFKWPRLDTSIAFTRNVSPELKQHAFDVRLNCLWSISGCRTSNQLLPVADEDKRQIDRATDERLNSDNPCPEWIIPRRVRDTPDIILTQVLSVRGAHNDEPQQYRFAKLQLIRLFKGELDARPLDAMGVAHTLDYFDPPIENPALKWMRPGAKVLMFSDSSLYIDSPCEVLPATDSAIGILERELRRVDLGK